jgi:PAS domain-containing protein
LARLLTRYYQTKEAELEIVRSEAKFRALYDSTSDAVLVLSQYKCFDCNPAAIRLFGAKSKESLCQKSALDLSASFQGYREYCGYVK